MVTTKSGNQTKSMAARLSSTAIRHERQEFLFDQKCLRFIKTNLAGLSVDPIIKNKLFGFFSYQGTRTFNGVAQNSTVFTPAQRGGDFSGGGALAGTSAIPLTGEDGIVHPAGTSYATLFPTNHIPTIDFDSVAANLLSKYIPLPNPAGGNSFQYSELITSKPNQYLGRAGL